VVATRGVDPGKIRPGQVLSQESAAQDSLQILRPAYHTCFCPRFRMAKTNRPDGRNCKFEWHAWSNLSAFRFTRSKVIAHVTANTSRRYSANVAWHPLW
jgi:hypothetical protein